MRKRNDIDYSQLADLLRNWENASLSDEGERKLEDAVYILESDDSILEGFISYFPEYKEVLYLYIELKEAMGNVAESVAVSETDYESRDADSFIDRLAAADGDERWRRRWKFPAIGAAAAAVALLVAVTAWIGLSRTPYSEERLSEMSTSEISGISDADEAVSVGSEVTPDPPVSPQPVAVQKVTHRRTEKQYVSSEKKEKRQLNADSMAWVRFMEMRAEMSEVVNPDLPAEAWNDIPDMMGSINDINLGQELSEGMNDAIETVNSLYR